MSTLTIAPRQMHATRPVIGPARRPAVGPAARPVTRPGAHPEPVRRTRRQAPPVRLTRRGRVVLTLLMLAVVLVALARFGGESAATRESGPVERTTTVVVSEGDTLWGIAAEVAGPNETREMVHRIQQLNSLPGPVLTEGQELAVPVE